MTAKLEILEPPVAPTAIVIRRPVSDVFEEIIDPTAPVESIIEPAGVADDVGMSFDSFVPLGLIEDGVETAIRSDQAPAFAERLECQVDRATGVD